MRHRPARTLKSIPDTVGAIVDNALAAWPDRLALVSRNARYTYGELSDEVATATAAFAALGVRAGDRVAATSANHAEIVIAFFAVQRLGALWIGINRSLAAPEKRFILEDCGANLYLAEGVSIDQIRPVKTLLPELRTLVDIGPDGEWASLLRGHRQSGAISPARDPYGPAAIAYTSGTTGHPKGVVHSQHNIVLAGAMASLSERADHAISRAGVALPLTILNLMILGPVASFLAGRTCILMDRIDCAGLTEWIRDERVQTFAAVPTIIYDLMTRPEVKAEDIASLTAPGVGGAAIPDSFRSLYLARFGRELSASYGLTEAPTVVSATDPTVPPVAGSSGKPARHLRVAVLDADGRPVRSGESGEVCVGAAESGEFAGLYTPMLGYWRRPEATAEALRGGWLRTGDVGRLDEHGELFIEGRRNDVVMRGGANIYPAEIERVVHMDERVAACAVVGKPDLRLGERVIAFIQPSADALPNPLFINELIELCRRHLDHHKIPEEWIQVADMPKNAMNKILKNELKKKYLPSTNQVCAPELPLVK